MPWLVHLDLVRDRRARADQAHLPAHDIDQLRQLVEVRSAQEGSQPGDARVGGDREPDALGLRVLRRVAADQVTHVVAVPALFRAGEHAPELVQRERPATEPEPLLAEEDRTSRLDFYGDRHRRKDRRDQDEADNGRSQVQAALGDPITTARRRDRDDQR